MHADIDKIPKDRLDEYLEEFIQCGLSNRWLKEDPKTGVTSVQYKLIVAYGRKKSNLIND